MYTSSVNVESSSFDLQSYGISSGLATGQLAAESQSGEKQNNQVLPNTRSSAAFHYHLAGRTREVDEGRQLL